MGKLMQLDIVVITQTKRIESFRQMLNCSISENGLRMLCVKAIVDSYAELQRRIDGDRKSIVIIDTAVVSEWQRAIAQLNTQFRFVNFCLLSKRVVNAVEAVNAGLNLCGYIDDTADNLEKQLTDFLCNIYPRITTVCNGLCAFDADGNRMVIAYDDIYYIDTIKQTGMCTVVHKNGEACIRAHITKLITELDGRFEITRSSTIANLSEVIKLTPDSLYFTDKISCLVTPKRLGGIRKALKVHMLCT